MSKKIKFKGVDLSKLLPKIHKKWGTPWIVNYIWKKHIDKVKVDLISYSQTKYEEKTIKNLDDLNTCSSGTLKHWINVSWVHNEKIIIKIWEIFNIHSLNLEDITNTTQRPKVEINQDYLYLILKMLYLHEETNDVIVEQVSVIVWKNYIITFQENSKDIFNQIRENIRESKWIIRKQKVDYLMFSIVDSIIDYYYYLLEDIWEKIEQIEWEIIENPSKNTQWQIYRLKRRLVYIKKPIWPLREIINSLIRDENKFITNEVKVYLRDVYDHTIQVIETIESIRDISSSLMDLYNSTIGNKMNEVMKILTIFASIFIPLTYLAWIYWMNFEYIPELSWQRWYFCFWFVNIVIFCLMLVYFRKNKWI